MKQINNKLNALMRRIPLLQTVFVIGLILSLSACQTSGDTTDDAPVNADSPASADAPPTAAEIRQLWESSAHADTFVIDLNNENNTCARCHAPINWIPSMDDIPSGCFSCKFEIEDPPPYIPESEWDPIECMVCHKVDGDDVEAEYKWLEIAAIEEYADVESVSDLCLKCHVGSELSDHMDISVIGVHETMTCTECHDAHDASSSCLESGCHDGFQAEDPPIVGHDNDHQNVNCVACHDAGNLDVGPSEEHDGMWLTFVSNPSNEETGTFPHTSHNLQLESLCTRCHYVDNPWDLSVDVGGAPES